MVPKHGSKIKPHNHPIDSMDGFARKDALRSVAMANTQKGVTTQTHHRGNTKSGVTHVETEFGNKPRPHK